MDASIVDKDLIERINKGEEKIVNFLKPVLVDEEKIFSEAEKRLGEEGKIRLQAGSYVIKVSV